MQPTDLAHHPEGGRFREVYRSGDRLHVPGRGERSALTHIYFALASGEVSHFHRVAADEIWNLYRGEGVYLFQWDGAAGLQRIKLSAETDTYCHVVPAHTWQAAAPVGDSVLVGCSVAPGFAFEDFELLRDHPEAAAALLQAQPGMARFVGR